MLSIGLDEASCVGRWSHPKLLTLTAVEPPHPYIRHLHAYFRVHASQACDNRSTCLQSYLVRHKPVEKLSRNPDTAVEPVIKFLATAARMAVTLHCRCIEEETARKNKKQPGIIRNIYVYQETGR